MHYITNYQYLYEYRLGRLASKYFLNYAGLGHIFLLREESGSYLLFVKYLELSGGKKRERPRKSCYSR